MICPFFFIRDIPTKEIQPEKKKFRRRIQRNKLENLRTLDLELQVNDEEDGSIESKMASVPSTEPVASLSPL